MAAFGLRSSLRHSLVGEIDEPLQEQCLVASIDADYFDPHEEIHDLRLSVITPLVKETMNNADELVSKDDPLTNTQMERLQLQVGSLTSMVDQIRTVLQSATEQDSIDALLELNFAVQDALDNYQKFLEELPPPVVVNNGGPSDWEPFGNEGGEGLADALPEPEPEPEKIEFEKTTEDCPTCWDDQQEGFALPKCNHFQCSLCWGEYLENKIQTGKVMDIICPNPDCDVILESEEIEFLLSKEMFEKYEQFVFLARLRLEKNARYCPNRNCDNAEIGDEEDEDFPKLTCKKCQTEFCFECSCEWHEAPITCEDAKERKMRLLSKEERERVKKEEKETADYFKKNSKTCLKCGSLVQKVSGCNHMQCTCGYEFCWICGEPIITTSDYPMHYKVSACAGLQFSDKTELSTGRKVVRAALAPIRYAVFGVGAVVAVPVYGIYRLRHR